MSNYFGTLDWGALFGAEIRVIDGERILCVPLKYNPSIRILDRRPVSLLNIVEAKYKDSEGNTHVFFPHIPHAIRQSISDADIVKMTRPIGRMRPVGEPAREPAKAPALDHNTLAARAVKDDDIPL